jgi:hypothetical protein
MAVTYDMFHLAVPLYLLCYTTFLRCSSRKQGVFLASQLYIQHEDGSRDKPYRSCK